MVRHQTPRRDTVSNSPLHQSAYIGDYINIQSILAIPENRKNINQLNHLGCSPLRLAATSGEEADDKRDVKHRKRKSATARRWQRWFNQTVLGFVSAVLLLFVTQCLLRAGLCPAGTDAAEGVASYCECSYYELHCVVTLITTKPEAILSLLLPLSIALLPVLLQIKEYITVVRPYLSESKGDTIFEKAQEAEERPNMQQELGFMGEVKIELEHLYELLREEEFTDSQFGCTRHYRLAVLIDDLDRCPQNVVVKVLEAVVLLLCDAPITVYLAIDPRVVTTAIEEGYGQMFQKAKISGEEFLDKIVQIPFCLPDIHHNKKRSFLSKTVEGGELDPEKIYQRITTRVHSMGVLMKWPTMTQTPDYLELLCDVGKELLRTGHLHQSLLRKAEMGMTELELLDGTKAGELNTEVDRENLLNMMSEAARMLSVQSTNLDAAEVNRVATELKADASESGRGNFNSINTRFEEEQSAPNPTGVPWQIGSTMDQQWINNGSTGSTMDQQWINRWQLRSINNGSGQRLKSLWQEIQLS